MVYVKYLPEYSSIAWLLPPISVARDTSVARKLMAELLTMGMVVTVSTGCW